MTKTRRARFSKRGGWFGRKPSFTGWGASRDRPPCNGNNVSTCGDSLLLGGGRKTVKRRGGKRKTGVKRKGSKCRSRRSRGECRVHLGRNAPLLFQLQPPPPDGPGPAPAMFDVQVQRGFDSGAETGRVRGCNREQLQSGAGTQA